MGTNSPTYDVKSNYAKKTIKELTTILHQFEKAVNSYPHVKMFNEHLAFIKMTIAERVGRKK